MIIDLGESVLTDRVFWDPAGAGGSAGKGFTVNGRTGTFNVTAAYAGGTSATGYDQLVLNFTGFDPGEEVRFSIDIDPASFIGFPQSVTAGAVTGVETLGRADVTVRYSDGTTQKPTSSAQAAPAPGRALAQPDIDRRAGAGASTARPPASSRSRRPRRRCPCRAKRAARCA